MARQTKWTDTLKKELLDFFKEEMKNGNTSVNKNAEMFAKKHKDLTPTQVRVAYYKFANADKYAENAAKRKEKAKKDQLVKNRLAAKKDSVSETSAVKEDKVSDKRSEKSNIKETYKTARWTEEENIALLEAVENKGSKTLLEVFSAYGKETKRNPKNVSQHYYILKNQKKHVSEKNSVSQIELLKEIMDIPHETMLLISEIANIFSKFTA